MRIWLVALIVIVALIGVADAYSLNNLSAGLSNGAYINIPYNLTYDGSFNVTATHLQLWLNNSNLTWTAATNKTLTGITYSASQDNYTFTASETIGYINFSVTMQNASNSYNLTANGTFVESRNTTASKDVWFNYTSTLPAVLTVTWNNSIGGGGGSPPATYIPPTPTSCTSVNGTTYINLTCSAGAGNITNGMNFTNTNTLVSSNGSAFYWNNTGLSQGTLYTYHVLAFNNSGGGTLSLTYATVTNTTQTTPSLPIPSITSYSNDHTGDSTVNFNVNSGTAVIFSVGANQTITTWTWAGATKIGGDGTTNSTASKTFTNLGANIVTAQGTNANGSTQIITWTVTVLSTGGVTIITNPANSVTTNSVILNGSASNVTAPLTVHFEYGSNPSAYIYKTDDKNIVSNNTFTSTVTGMPLISNSNYHYRAIASDGVNTFYGNDVGFMTTALAPITDYQFDKHLADLINAKFNLTILPGVTIAPFSDILGSIVYGIIFGMIFIMLWMRSEDISIPALVGLLIGASLWSMMPPEWVSMAYSLTIVSFAGLVYSLIKKP